MTDQNQPQQPQRNPQTNPDEGDGQTTEGAAAEDFSDNENSLGSAPNTRPENRTNADANA